MPQIPEKPTDKQSEQWLLWKQKREHKTAMTELLPEARDDAGHDVEQG
jgi:hypothetical protein